MVASQLLIAKMKRDRFGASAERGRKLLDQLEMQLEELETRRRGRGGSCTDAVRDDERAPFTRQASACAAAFASARERRVAHPDKLPVLRGKLAKLGESITETLESIPRTYK